MFDRDIWSEILYSIKKNKLRTFLTGFSVAWGIFILVMLLASVKGMENGFTKTIMRDASNSMFIYPSETTKTYRGLGKKRKIKFTNNDINYIKSNFKNYVEEISPVLSRLYKIKYENEIGTYKSYGITPEIKNIENLKIESGRFVNNNDIKNLKKVVVIGVKTKEDLFKKKTAIGHKVQINNNIYRVIGCFSDNGNERDERKVYLPITTLQRVNKNTTDISYISIGYNKKLNLEEAKNLAKTITFTLKRKHQTSQDDQAIYLSDSIEDFTNMTKFVNLLQTLSIAVGILILLAGIIGIGNILVFIIKERTKEIGIRKALGAKPIQIINLVLLESIFITTLSGMIGVIFAMLVVNTIGPLIDIPAFSNPSVDIRIILTALLILIFSGVTAGIIPAIRAAKVKPIIALKED